MRIFLMSALVASMAVVGCANNTPTPQETPITVQLKGTTPEVQQFIEDRVIAFGHGAYKVENATDRILTLKADCNQLPNQKPFQCALIMMQVGNSKWDGPYLMVNFRTNQIREMVSVSVQSEWCAINVFGKSNCMPVGNTNENNETLRRMKDAFENERK